MFITVTAVGIACFLWGAAGERYRWVKAAKNDKVIAVGGNLYKVTKTGDNAG